MADKIIWENFDEGEGGEEEGGEGKRWRIKRL